MNRILKYPKSHPKDYGEPVRLDDKEAPGRISGIQISFEYHEYHDLSCPMNVLFRWYVVHTSLKRFIFSLIETLIIESGKRAR